MLWSEKIQLTQLKVFLDVELHAISILPAFPSTDRIQRNTLGIQRSTRDGRFGLVRWIHCTSRPIIGDPWIWWIRQLTRDTCERNQHHCCCYQPPRLHSSQHNHCSNDLKHWTHDRLVHCVSLQHYRKYGSCVDTVSLSSQHKSPMKSLTPHPPLMFSRIVLH